MTFHELYDAHFAFVWRSLRRLGVAEADLPDVLQEVFLVAYRKLPEFEGRARVTTWLFRIAMGAARDRWRKAHTRREVLGVDVVDFPGPAPTQEEALQRSEDIRLIERALSSLNVDQRAVFALFELEEMSGEEIAEALQIPLGTVYSRLRLARGAFQRAVQAELARRHHPLRPVREASS